jgi:hypothetical protein
VIPPKLREGTVPGDDRYQYGGHDTAELDRIRRDLAVSLALSAPGSPARVPINADLDAVNKELARRAEARC